MRMTFKTWTGNIKPGEYGNGRLALSLIADNGEPIAVCTVNLPDLDIEEGHVAIKDYSENEGMLAALIEAEIVEEPSALVKAERVEFPICKLTNRALVEIYGIACECGVMDGWEVHGHLGLEEALVVGCSNCNHIEYANSDPDKKYFDENAEPLA